jgi:hypothetical protein
MSSVRNWAVGSVIAALILLSPVVAFLIVIIAELVIDFAMEAGTAVDCTIAAGAIGWALFRKRSGTSCVGASVRAGRGPRRSGHCSPAYVTTANANPVSVFRRGTPINGSSTVSGAMWPWVVRYGQLVMAKVSIWAQWLGVAAGVLLSNPTTAAQPWRAGTGAHAPQRPFSTPARGLKRPSYMYPLVYRCIMRVPKFAQGV